MGLFATDFIICHLLLIILSVPFCIPLCVGKPFCRLICSRIALLTLLPSVPPARSPASIGYTRSCSSGSRHRSRFGRRSTRSSSARSGARLSPRCVLSCSRASAAGSDPPLPFTPLPARLALHPVLGPLRARPLLFCRAHRRAACPPQHAQNRLVGDDVDLEPLPFPPCPPFRSLSSLSLSLSLSLSCTHTHTHQSLPSLAYQRLPLPSLPSLPHDPASLSLFPTPGLESSPPFSLSFYNSSRPCSHLPRSLRSPLVPLPPATKAILR